MILKTLRQSIGHLIIFADFISRPKQLKRSPEVQALVNDQTANLSLYQFYACPFCIKARRAIRRLNLKVETRDALQAGQHREDLAQGGGKIRVPCLRIQNDENEHWLYESDAIITYLEEKFGTEASNAPLNTQNT